MPLIGFECVVCENKHVGVLRDTEALFFPAVILFQFYQAYPVNFAG